MHRITCNILSKSEEREMATNHQDIRVKHGSVSAVTLIPVTFYADVCVYKKESCDKTMFRKNVLQANFWYIISVKVYLHF
jgi:hypothetical protein